MKSLLENMNIALVHDWLTNVAGAEKVLLVLKEIFPKAPIYTSVFDSKKARPFQKFDIRTTFLQNLPLVKNKREALIPLTPLAFENIDLGEFDLVISNTTMPAKGVITKPETIHICYCHTPTRYLWEPELDPRASKGAFSGFRRKIAHHLRIWDKVASDRPDYYFANSKYISKRIKKYYGRDSIVIYPPVDVNQFVPGDQEKVQDYYLFVSRLIGYKKCDIVIEAFNKLGLPLMIIGSGPEKKYLQKIAKDNIEFLGFLDDMELKKYYSQAKAFIFAAEEDFGIVPVEAMASGRPVIAYSRGGATETVVEGKTGLFFNQQTAKSLINAVKKFDPKKFDSKIIRQQAEKFSTERFKKEFREAVEKIITKH
jgi:glycosyltransferase involved in cell wall biosynthesis